MPSRTVTLDLPGEVVERLQAKAEQTQRPLEAELLDLIVTAMQNHDALPSHIADVLAQLPLLDSQSLNHFAQARLSAEELAELETLNQKQQREGLTSVERQQRDDLLAQYERTVVVRAEAAALLHDRDAEASVPRQA